MTRAAASARWRCRGRRGCSGRPPGWWRSPSRSGGSWSRRPSCCSSLQRHSVGGQRERALWSYPWPCWWPPRTGLCCRRKSWRPPPGPGWTTSRSWAGPRRRSWPNVLTLAAPSLHPHPPAHPWPWPGSGAEQSVTQISISSCLPALACFLEHLVLLV